MGALVESGGVGAGEKVGVREGVAGAPGNDGGGVELVGDDRSGEVGDSVDGSMSSIDLVVLSSAVDLGFSAGAALGISAVAMILRSAKTSLPISPSNRRKSNSSA